LLKRARRNEGETCKDVSEEDFWAEVI